MDTRTPTEKLQSLKTERRELLAQYRRNVHTGRTNGIQRYIDKIDRQIRDFERSIASQ